MLKGCPQKPLYWSKTNAWRICIRYHYYFSSKFNWYCKKIRNNDNSVNFHITNCKHFNHPIKNKKVAAITQALVLIKNPGSLNQTSVQLIYSVRETGLTVGFAQENSLKMKICKITYSTQNRSHEKRNSCN